MDAFYLMTQVNTSVVLRYLLNFKKVKMIVSTTKWKTPNNISFLNLSDMIEYL